MIKYEYTPEMDEVSGMGGGYEATCRAMVIAGLEWAEKKGVYALNIPVKI